MRIPMPRILTAAPAPGRSARATRVTRLGGPGWGRPRGPDAPGRTPGQGRAHGGGPPRPVPRPVRGPHTTGPDDVRPPPGQCAADSQSGPAPTETPSGTRSWTAAP